MWNPFKKQVESTGVDKSEKLSKPKDLPASVGRDLVVRMKKDPDWVWKLKCVMRGEADRNTHMSVRVFDPVTAAESKAVIQHYHSLDSFPELILFEGWVDNKSMTTELREVKHGTSSSRAA